MVEKIKYITIMVLLLGIAFYEFYKVPTLEKQINSQETKTEMVFLPGRVDTVTEVDTLWREPVAAEPEVEEETDTTKLYTTAVEDSLIKGTIYSEVGLGATLNRSWLDYRFKRPIYSTQRTDTVVVTKTLTNTIEVRGPKNFRVQAGIGTGIGPNTFGLGPSVQVLNKNDVAYSYTWDALNNIHWVSLKYTIRLW